MKLVPAIINRQASAAEQRIFRLLHDCQGWNVGLAFHSLGLSHHPTKPVSELDFVVVSQRGILVIEVKGGGISHISGQFITRDRYGTQHAIQNPFQQAQSGTFALRRRLQQLFPEYQLLTGYAVAFPDVHFTVESVEWDDNIVIDSRDCASPAAFSAALERIYAYWEGKVGVHALDGKQIDNLIYAMRPDFERAVSISRLVEETTAQQLALTQEQYDFIDTIADNPRVLCAGGAGTGKTFLLVEAARRRAAQGQKVLVTCFSPLLAQDLSGLLTDEGVTVLPFEALGELREQFDALLIDEGQDIMSSAYLHDVVDQRLQGGLQNGGWNIFYDPNLQARIYNRFDEAAEDFLRKTGATRVHLRRNCRNTREIASSTMVRTGGDIGNAVSGSGLNPVELSWNEVPEQAAHVARIIHELLQDGAAPEEIALLSPYSFEKSVFCCLPDGLAGRIQPWADAGRGNFRFARIDDFKGLESRYVIIGDLEESAFSDSDTALAWLYVGMTRARAALWLLIHSAYRSTLDHLALQHLEQLKQGNNMTDKSPPAMPSPSVSDPREGVLHHLERELVGPASGPEEVLSERPVARYMMGILFPKEPQAELPTHTFQDIADEESEEETHIEAESSSLPKDEDQDPTFLAGKWEPSSVGISLFLEEPAVEIDVFGARYDRTAGGRKQEWHRRQLAEREHPEVITIKAPAQSGVVVRDALLGRASIHTLWRRLPAGWLVTVSLVNVAMAPGKGKKDPADCLFQVGLRCRPVQGRILPYPQFEAPSLDREEDELRLLYRHDHTYAVGHGCAPHWVMDGEKVIRVETTFLPAREVRPLTQEVPGLRPEILDIAQVAEQTRSRREILEDYREMVAAYEKWLTELPQKHMDIPAHLHTARDRLRAQVQKALERMKAGVTLLETDDTAWQAYTLATRAMLLQMRHSRPDLGGTRRTLDVAPEMPDRNDSSKGVFLWRPFQLAFMLMTLPSLHDEQDLDRLTVDLIWFPTGGGKTEAYLLAAAYIMVLRRLRYGNEGGGTAVITRYTLRLLTAQQFRRTSALICALEWLRTRGGVSELGDEAFSIGLWVGEGSTPNRYADAESRFTALLEEDQPENPFVLDSCPWCGTEIIPARHHDNVQRYGVTATSRAFAFHCTNPACDFHDHLPVQVVDEGLYEAPPTFLLGTVDKFAMVTWKAEAGNFFGSTAARPPELIIQDELHLLSGPLGTTVGLYECALQQLPQLRGGRAKIIASTATIRRASEQVRSLFNRQVQLFPPSGLSADDSFFARRDDNPERAGRLYIGLMSPHQSMKTAMTQAGAALVEAPRVVTTLPPLLADSYSTLVTYYNSLRELGQGRKLAQDDIPSRLKSLYNRTDIFESDQVCELTSNLNGGELTDLLGRLALDPGSPQHVAVLATSNMLSVGVDIGRLGLMLMAGQPKTSSEYIQATSRVGREAKRPGTVVVLYSPGKPRDRSHYETFPTYHASLYRYVEPASVTPFSLPSRERALHAVFTTLVRHGVPGMSPESAAGLFDRNSEAVRDIASSILKWVVEVDAREYEQTARTLERIQDQWEERARQVNGTGRKLVYGSHGRNIPGLLRSFDNHEANGLWKTLQNMRSVDEMCTVSVYSR